MPDLFSPILFRRPLRLLMSMAVVALAGCAATATHNRGQLELTGAQWELVEWPALTMQLPEAHPVLVRFDHVGDEDRLSGHSGCNQFSAPYVLRDAGEVTIATPVATRMACPAAYMEFEARFLDKLESIANYRIDGNRLTLTAADGHVLRFRARNKTGAGAAIKFIYVAPLQVECGKGAAATSTAAPGACYLIRERQDAPWQLWQAGIAGFDFEPGVAYRLRILEERPEERSPRPRGPAGTGAAADSVKWTLDIIVEQESAGVQ